MQQRAVRLKDIAAEAGVSLAAVSRILRDQNLHEFGAETQQRVRDAADRLGWRPNLLVRGLQTGRTGTIGVFVAPFDTYWTAVLYGIHDALLSAGRVPIVLWPHALVHPAVNDDGSDHARGMSIGHSPVVGDDLGGGRHERERLTRLIDRRVDAVIAWPLFDADAVETLTAAGRRGWPIVTIDDALPDDAAAVAVTSDEAEAARLVLNHLAGLGHRQIALVDFDRDQLWCQRRREALLAEARRAKVDLAGNRLSVSVASSGERGAIVRFLRERPNLTAIIGSTDHLAAQAIEAVRSLGREVPRDLSVVGYGNEMLSTSVVGLTTIDQDPHRIGLAAAGAALEAGEDRPRLVAVPGWLVERESTRRRAT